MQDEKLHILYDYYGLLISFRQVENLPIKVYGVRGTLSSRAVIEFNKGLISFKMDKSYKNSLDAEDTETLQLLIERNISEIVKAWLDIFIYDLPWTTEVIRKNIREEL